MTSIPRYHGGKYVITTLISPENYNLAKAKGIRWVDAIARGVRILSESGSIEKDVVIQQDKISKLTSLLSQTSFKATEMEEELKKTREELAELRGKVNTQKEQQQVYKSEEV